MNSKEYLVTLNVPASLEEAMVDCLLVFESEHGFSSFQVNAHDHKNVGLSLLEQVSGRQKKIRFQIYVPETGLAPFLAELKQRFTGANINYWVLPVFEHGVI
ncbi:MAG: hypothetical protein CTY18_06560 [Methylomonas sp.]|nr:MAG: hypothetical protein CTY24_11855 [Methylobacter sp.]PPD35315.1 MAG: hypothetical protein CTY18_06560 [Methylomonas sp.]